MNLNPKMAPVIEEVAEIGCFQLAEGPHWDTESQSLYFVDIPGKSVHKYVPSTKQHTKIVFEKSPSFIIPVKGSSDRFVISLQRDICVITWDGVSSKPSHVETIATVDTHPGGEENILNDAKVDPFGNLWTGTLSTKIDMEKASPIAGSIYCVSNKQLKKCVSGICASNGLAWSKDSKKMYFIDSVKKTVDQFDYDFENLTISNCQPLFSFNKHGILGFPDGQTIDEEGNVWVAVFEGQKILNISTKQPDTLLSSIHVPENLITSVCFGGKNLDELYVTACGVTKYTKDTTKPIKGALYKITGLGVKGLPAEKFCL